MSLTASPSGFALQNHPSGQSRAYPYTIAANYATAIGRRDLVSLNTNGTIVAGAATTDLIGAFAGVSYKDSTGKPSYSDTWPGAIVGATDIVAWVYDDPQNVYRVQVASGGTGYVQAAIGDQADLVAGTPSAVTGISGQALSATLAGAGIQAQLRVIGFVDGAVYDAITNPFPEVLVQIARHQFISNKVAV